MSVSVTMPRLGESVSEGTVTRWLKSEGDQVDADEPLLEVSTDKVDTEIPSPASGVLSSIKVAEDETVDVGTELALIDDGASASEDSDDSKAEKSEPAEDAAEPEEGKAEPEAEPEPESEPEEPAAEESAEAEEAEESEATEADGEPEEEPEESAPAAKQDAKPKKAEADEDEGGQGASYVTPLVRRLAAEHGVDLADVTGTGVGGRIRKQDVIEASEKGSGGGKAKSAEPAASKQEAPKPAAEKSPPRPAKTPAAKEQDAAAKIATPARGSTEKLSRLRQVIAERMTESLQISAQLTTVVEADLTKIARLRERAKRDFEAREGVKLTYLPFFALATCESLREHPVVNSSIDIDAGTVTYHDTVHLGVAVDTPRGLLVPVLKDASDLNLAGIARKVDDLAARTRENHITPDELVGGTFTLTNTGSRGALFDTPIINQPQVGILGTGSVVKRPVVIDDAAGEVIGVRHVVYLALTYDHRMVDGADAARFLTSVKGRLEDGEFEADLGL